MVKPKLIMDSAVRNHAITDRSAAMSVRSTAMSVFIRASSLDDFGVGPGVSGSVSEVGRELLLMVGDGGERIVKTAAHEI